MRVAEGYEGDTLYHMRPLGAQNLEKLPAEVLVARSVALRVVKGEHRKGGKRGGRATRAESVLMRAAERLRARRADSMYVEPPSRAGGRMQAQSYPHTATRRRGHDADAASVTAHAAWRRCADDDALNRGERRCNRR